MPVTVDGLTATTKTDGSMDFVDGKGKTAARLGAAVMWDASVDPVTKEHKHRKDVTGKAGAVAKLAAATTGSAAARSTGDGKKWFR